MLRDKKNALGQLLSKSHTLKRYQKFVLRLQNEQLPAQKETIAGLTLKAVGVEQVLAFFVGLDPALGAPDALPGDAPQQALALVAVGGRGGRPQDEVVRGGARDWVD